MLKLQIHNKCLAKYNDVDFELKSLDWWVQADKEKVTVLAF